MLQDYYQGNFMSIGENLKRLRRDKGWTQGELANKCKIQLGQISKIERDETDPKLSTIYSIMNALECSADALLIDTERSNVDSVMAVALERVKQIPDKDKQILLTVIDKYCIALSMQQLTDRKTLFGIPTFVTGSTPEMTRKSDEG
ncbi:helix-turn-helix domain-containing protein [Shewanella cutis]|uniref:Helix-turn-helix transcriptional regulator n=3 Tax=Shewanella TaxID=22 RepID=A0ABS9R175_9GAMM|nr:helix-turn-helix transcriptional regulator [Shewanella sp. PS-2]ESE42762.1 dna-binding helix-turn-helix protein [Shewanella decolorationis S12]MCG9966304.1 helix-turn-helix transcriptional regulator [Shewanella sp. PS-2]